MYDFTIEEIKKKINDVNEYFDPQYFTSLLEHVFQCNIFVFTRARTSKDANLTLPRHSQFFYKRNYDRPCIFIYEHWGLKADTNTYPYCELITSYLVKDLSKTVPVYYNHPYNWTMCENIRKYYDQLRQGYSLNEQIPDTVFHLYDLTEVNDFDIIGQGIDSYGKCRMIVVRIEQSKFVTLLLSPMPPFPVKEVENWTMYTVPVDEAKHIMENKFQIKITKRGVVDNLTKSLTGISGNVTVTILVTDNKNSAIISEIPSTPSIDLTANNLSALSNYIQYKKISRYVVAYLFWLYSNYMSTTQQIELSEESMIAFLDKFIIIDPNFTYTTVNKNFPNITDVPNLTNGVMFNGFLIVKSEETLRRLMYVLRIEAVQKDKLRNYYTRTTIENYYEDITDLDQYQNQVVLQGEKSVQKWIQEIKLTYDLHNSVQINATFPYFFKNNLISDTVWLAQNTSDLFNALKIGKIWKDYGYNPGKNPDQNPSINEEIAENAFTLYAYKNALDINKHVFEKEGSNPNEIKILGYLIQRIPFYTVLLQL